MKQKILVFHVGSIGDTIVAIEAMERIRLAHPNTEIHLLSCPGTKNRNYLSLIENANIFNRITHLYIPPKNYQRIIPYLKIFFYALFAHYHIVFSIMPFRRNFALDRIFFFLAGCYKYINLIELDAHSLSTTYLPVRDLLKKNLDLWNFPACLHSPIVFSEECKKIACEVWERCKKIAKDKEIVVCGVGGKNPVCRWRIENWIELNRLLKESNLFPVFIGGSEDRSCAEKIITTAGNGAWIPQPLTLLQMMFFLSKAKIYVGHDTGTIHMAAYVNLCSIGIYSSRNDRGLWYPACEKSFVFRNEVLCQGCDKTVCDKSEEQICTNLTTPCMVFAKILEWLDK